MARTSPTMSSAGISSEKRGVRVEDYVSERSFEGARRLSEGQAAEIRATYERIYGPVAPTKGSYRGRRTFEGL